MGDVQIPTIGLAGDYVTLTRSVVAGTANTDVTVDGTRISGQQVVAELSFSAWTISAIAGAANEAVGKLIYTLPAGAIFVRAVHMNIGLTNTDTTIDADTPDVGIGTVIATGAVATLDGTSTFEDLLTGQTAANCTGTKTVKGVTDQTLFIGANGVKTIHLNVADGWAGSETALAATGEIHIEYVALS